MIRIAVVEDDKGFRDLVESYLKTYREEHGTELSVHFFEDGSQLVFEYNPDYDILLMDIEMPGLNGMDAAREIRKKDNNVIIIFITNMAQYAINGYEVGALDYILKPVKYFPFSLKLTKAISSIRQQRECFLLLPSEEGIHRVSSKEIIYVEIRDHWLHVFTQGEEYQMLGTMKELAERLKENHFVLCSASYLINLKYVTAVLKDTVVLCDQYELKVSRSRKKALRQEVLNYYKEGLR